MKRQSYSYIGVSFVVLVFGIIFIPKIVSRISQEQVVDLDRHNLGHAREANRDLATIGLAPSFSLTNQNNDILTDQDLLGQVYVVEFFFTTCPSICPIMTNNLLNVQKTYTDELGLSIISVSINPNYDTPEILSEYAKSYGINHPNWHLLTGDSKGIFAMANTGFNLYVGPGSELDGGFEHSGFFALVDAQGNIRSRYDQYGNPIVYYDGLETVEVYELIDDISILLRERL